MAPMTRFRRRIGKGINLHMKHGEEQLLLEAIKKGEIDKLERILRPKQSVNGTANKGHFHRKSTALHVAAYHGKTDVVALLIQMGGNPNARNAYGQTPLMFACKVGNASCVERLLQHSADALAFESLNGSTCLHIACRHGHMECVVKLLDAARNGPISTTWGFTRFVNVRDHNGATPLHMAARTGHAEIVRLLLNHGALISVVTCNSTFGPGHGSTPLHCAARSGSLSCVEELLAWGADRLRKDILGNTPYTIATHRGHVVCAAILNPNAAEPLVWPSPLKFIQELEPETRSTLQAALADANRARNTAALIVPTAAKKTKTSSILTSLCFGSQYNSRLYENRSEEDGEQLPSLKLEEVGSGYFTCCICFESYHKMIEVDICGHQMCAACTMALCCLTKSSTPASSPSTPSCPFCRQDIVHLKLAKAPSIQKVSPFPSTISRSASPHAGGRKCKSLGREISFSSKKQTFLDLYV